MNHDQASDTAQDTLPGPAEALNTGPSLQRASILFIASVGSFIGASLLLASM